MKTSHLLKTILFSIFTIQIGFAQSVILDPLNGIFAKSYQDSLAGTRINIKSKLYNEEISFYLSGRKVANFKDNTFQLNSNGNDIFIGDSVGLNDDGSFHYNVAMGYHAFKTNTTGGGNVGIGRSSLEKNESGSNNVSIGTLSLSANENGANNTSIGSYSMFKNTTGYYNTSVGSESLYANVSGVSNTAMGNFSLFSNSSGSLNTAIGMGSLLKLKSGSRNVALGYDAGRLDTLGNNNVYIGTGSGSSSTPSDRFSRDGSIFIGNNSGTLETRSNRLYIENSSSKTPLIYGNFEEDSLKVNGNLEVTENVNTSGFTQLGEESPAIKLKTILDTSPDTEGGTKSIPHGLTAGQIINVSVYINNSSQNWIPPNYNSGPNYEYDYYFNNTSVVLKTMAANSSNVTDKPLKILITYTE